MGVELVAMGEGVGGLETAEVEAEKVEGKQVVLEAAWELGRQVEKEGQAEAMVDNSVEQKAVVALLVEASKEAGGMGRAGAVDSAGLEKGAKAVEEALQVDLEEVEMELEEEAGARQEAAELAAGVDPESAVWAAADLAVADLAMAGSKAGTQVVALLAARPEAQKAVEAVVAAAVVGAATVAEVEAAEVREMC